MIVAGFARGPAGAAAPPEPRALAVGSVRDQTGAPVVGARVRALANDGTQLGSGLTDAAGTFALSARGSASILEIACRWCATARVPVDTGPTVAIVRRYAALVGGLSQRDLLALPYDRPADAVGVLPFVVPVSNAPPYPASVSDRGLDRGRGLTFDEGIPAYDMTGYANGLADFPDRSLQSVEVERADRAFAYGNYAGGGALALASSGEAGRLLEASSGLGAAVAGYGRFGGVVPEFALSRNDADGLARERANFDATIPFAGGELSAVLGASGLRTFAAKPAPFGSADRASLVYATRSRRYRTFASIVGFDERTILPNPTGDLTASGGTLVSSFRLEHPATVNTALEVLDQRSTGAYAVGGVSVAGRALQDSVTFEAQGGDERTSYDFGANLSQLDVRTWRDGYQNGSSGLFLLPALVVQTGLSRGFGLRVSASQSLRIPTLYEWYAGPKTSSVPAESGTLLDGALTYDDARRFRVEALLFRENLADVAPRGTNGVGLSVAWQIAPLLSLRAWTLNDSGEQDRSLAATLYGSPSLSRGVAWLSYENPSALRFDALVHRDRNGSGAPAADLDGSATVPLNRSVAATFGTLRRDSRRRFYAGLRFMR
ncbi:MAG: TonB-dependent receptor plug domain-containing protein [Candidatus Baltobacteraceae bacterium]